MLFQSILSFNQLRDLFQQKDTLFLAVSGGPDSMVMLDFFYRIKADWSLEIIVLTVDHQLRGEESILDADLVEAEAKKRGLHVIRGEVDVKKHQRDHEIGMQEASRQLRYDFFKEQMQGWTDAKLVMAHHGDDQAETMAMQLTKGVRVKGIPVKSTLGQHKIIRPFLCVDKQELYDYATSNHVNFREDPSNENDDYTRNRFRKNILPFLKAENPNLIEGIQRLSETYLEEDQLLDDLAEKQIRSFSDFCEQTVKFPVEDFINLPLSLQRRGFHLILNYLQIPIGKKDYFIEFSEWIQSDKTNSTYPFKDDYLWIKSYGKCEIRPNNRDEKPYSFAVSLDEQIQLPNGWMISAEEKAAHQLDGTKLGEEFFLCDKRHIVFPLTIRSRKAGDRIRLLGLDGTKKVKDIFIDKKVPGIDRENWPIIENGDGELLWLPLLGRSELARLDDSTDRLIMIKVSKG